MTKRGELGEEGEPEETRVEKGREVDIGRKVEY